MMGTWQPRFWVRRALFLSSNALAVALIVVGVILPVRDISADRDAQIIHQREALARWKAVAAQESTVRNIADQVAANQGEFLGTKNEGVVQAELQASLKGMVEKAGARVRSIRSLPSQTDPAARHIGSRVELYGPLQAVHRAIYAVENAKPYLFVMGAIMRPAPTAGQAGASQEPVVEAQLDIFGLMRVVANER